MELTREKIDHTFKEMAFETHLKSKEKLEINEDDSRGL